MRIPMLLSICVFGISLNATAADCIQSMRCSLTEASQFAGTTYEDPAAYNRIKDIAVLRVKVQRRESSAITTYTFDAGSAGTGSMADLIRMKRQDAQENLSACNDQKDQFESQYSLCRDYQD